MQNGHIFLFSFLDDHQRFVAQRFYQQDQNVFKLSQNLFLLFLSGFLLRLFLFKIYFTIQKFSEVVLNAANYFSKQLPILTKLQLLLQSFALHHDLLWHFDF